MNNIGITPLGYNILLEMPDEEKVTESGIILTSSKTDQLYKFVGKIIAIGSDAFTNAFGNLDPKSPKEGEYVLINRHAGSDIRMNDKLYRIVSSDDVRCIIEYNTFKILSSKFNKVV